MYLVSIHCINIKLSIEDSFSKCERIRSFLPIYSYLPCRYNVIVYYSFLLYYSFNILVYYYIYLLLFTILLLLIFSLLFSFQVAKKSMLTRSVIKFEYILHSVLGAFSGGIEMAHWRKKR